MRLYAKLFPGGWEIVYKQIPNAAGWYEILREPDLENREYLEYSAVKDLIEIKQRPKTQNEIDAENATIKKEEIGKLFTPRNEFRILRETLKKIRDGVTGVDFTEFDNYNQAVEDILNK